MNMIWAYKTPHSLWGLSFSESHEVVSILWNGVTGFMQNHREITKYTIGIRPPHTKICPPMERVLAKVWNTSPCLISIERAYQRPYLMLMYIWYMPKGNMLRNIIKAMPPFKHQKDIRTRRGDQCSFSTKCCTAKRTLAKPTFPFTPPM